MCFTTTSKSMFSEKRKGASQQPRKACFPQHWAPVHGYCCAAAYPPSGPGDEPIQNSSDPPWCTCWKSRNGAVKGCPLNDAFCTNMLSLAWSCTWMDSTPSGTCTLAVLTMGRPRAYWLEQGSTGYIPSIDHTNHELIWPMSSLPGRPLSLLE